ncbi:MAG TPA: tol-pal system protein YbgF [Gemmatimonadaceae bacterium]|nr:tol-pal system protein YbgF [Gemmatimonadaceae bacterium]
MIKLRRTFSLSAAGLGGTAPLSAVLIPLVCASCFFATKQDIDRLQQDITGNRISSSAADSVQRAQLIELSRSVRTLNDSISALSKKVSAMRTASESEMTAMRENISQLQDLSGQSEQRLRDVRAALEEKRQQQEPSPATPDSTGVLSAPTTGPGPLQLLQAGRDQLLKGGNAAARSAFNELITKYPKSEYVPEAMFYTAQAYAAERNLTAADAEYSSLIAKYPSSPRVPTAMYKRALQLQAAKKNAEAKKLYQDIIKRFPRSDEAALADERLQSMR